jgi:hypothetical protein
MIQARKKWARPSNNDLAPELIDTQGYGVLAF